MTQENPLCIPQGATVRQAMKAIDHNKQGIVLVVDGQGCLVGTITDGDVRRFLLTSGGLDEPADPLVWRNPVTAPQDATHAELLELLAEHKLRNIPLLDQAGRPTGVFSLRDALEGGDGAPVAAILAGGEGKRLRPLTNDVPKPMLQVGDTPLLQRIVENLVSAGFKRIHISVNYKRELIEKHFGDGAAFGAQISYLREETKLDTAGPLALLPPPAAPLLVINGDVYTAADLERLYEFHLAQRCVMTVAATEYRVKVPYGVLKLAGHLMLGMEEKPEQTFYCNGGIYVINPEILRLIPRGQPFGMNDLLERVLSAGLPVAAFPIHESWVDVGQMTDLERACRQADGEGEGE
ncbi:MAG: nucleotidyltransferase family protein [Desulfarculaceae bacterium]|nr:nucleotidyltransferase family protein [Desulfarculaceae bacterium]MCF8072111.1 nucleotidyltransferase family protein [Desulfarculaceae bacterium]MCF8100032.1 nucleotidyltransferase family protein [Desulfarculaceae bacterium]